MLFYDNIMSVLSGGADGRWVRVPILMLRIVTPTWVWVELYATNGDAISVDFEVYNHFTYALAHFEVICVGSKCSLIVMTNPFMNMRNTSEVSFRSTLCIYV